MPQTYFGPLPREDTNFDQLLQWLMHQTISVQKLIGGTIQAIDIVVGSGGTISSSNWVAGTSGWQIDGDGNAEFNDVTVRGDIVSSNWDGADPANLASGPDLTATLGFYLDSSAGAAQFTGPVYFSPPDESTEGSGVDLEFGDTFFLRVYQDNPTSGEDSLWLGPTTNNTDHIVIGPPSGASRLKNFRLKAVNTEVEGTLTFDTTPGSANEQIIFDDPDYSIFQDNTGSGTDGSRLWIDGPNEGEFVLGPRAGSSYLNRLLVISDFIRYEWSDGTDGGIHTWPKGIVYDFGFDTTTGEATAGAYPSNISGLVATATVPANISITVMVWGHIRIDFGQDNGELGFFEIQIGGTAPVAPAAIENDLTTDTDATSSSSTSHDHSVTSGSFAVWNAGAGVHTGVGAGLGNSGSASAAHTHSHSHAMSSQFRTIPYVGMRSFTPTGSSLSIQAVGGRTSGALTYDDGLIMYLVLVN